MSTTAQVPGLLGPLGPTDVDPDRVRDVACDATAPSQLCDPPEFDPDVPDANLPELGAPGAGIGLLGQVLVVMLVVALLLALAWLVFRWRQGRGSGTDGDGSGRDDRDEAVDAPLDARVIDHESPPERWRRLAAEHRDAGRYRDAIRCEYRALVGDLARAGYVDEIPGRTSGEERQQVAQVATRHHGSDGAVAAAFDVAADIFDVAWFDDGVVTRGDDDRFVAARTAVLDTILAGGPSGSRR